MTRESETWTQSANESAEIAEAIGIDWAEVPFDADRFHVALLAELAAVDGGPDDEIPCARLALARLVEDPDHYGAAPGPDG